MVAWIKEEGDLSNRRLLVSQDFDEIYLTFADYGKEWLGYIKETGKAAGFLTMKRDGP